MYLLYYPKNYRITTPLNRQMLLDLNVVNRLDMDLEQENYGYDHQKKNVSMRLDAKGAHEMQGWIERERSKDQSSTLYTLYIVVNSIQSIYKIINQSFK